MRRLILLGLAVAAVDDRDSGPAAPPSTIEAEIGGSARRPREWSASPPGGIDGRGPRVLINADKAFPMASTFKVAVAGAVLRQGRRRPGLARPAGAGRVGDGWSNPRASPTTFSHPGVSVSVRNLLELMLTVSDNTATDCADQARGRAGRGHRLGAPPGHRGPARRPRHGGPDPRFLPYRRRARFPRRSRPRSRPIRSSRTRATSRPANSTTIRATPRTPRAMAHAGRSHLHRQGAEPGSTG